MYCCVPDCPSTYRKYRNLWYHGFPKPNEKVPWVIEGGDSVMVCRRALWGKQLKIEEITNTMKVCSQHFLFEDYCKSYRDIYQKRHHRLLKTAYPTQNLPKQNHNVKDTVCETATKLAKTVVDMSSFVVSEERTEIIPDNTKDNNNDSLSNDSVDLDEIKPDITDLPPLCNNEQKREFSATPDGENVEEQLEKCDTYYFLMSTLHAINSLPLNRQMHLRCKIQDLIYDELEKNNSS